MSVYKYSTKINLVIDLGCRGLFQSISFKMVLQRGHFLIFSVVFLSLSYTLYDIITNIIVIVTEQDFGLYGYFQGLHNVKAYIGSATLITRCLLNSDVGKDLK